MNEITTLDHDPARKSHIKLTYLFQWVAQIHRRALWH